MRANVLLVLLLVACHKEGREQPPQPPPGNAATSPFDVVKQLQYPTRPTFGSDEAAGYYQQSTASSNLSLPAVSEPTFPQFEVSDQDQPHPIFHSATYQKSTSQGDFGSETYGSFKLVGEPVTESTEKSNARNAICTIDWTKAAFAKLQPYFSSLKPEGDFVRILSFEYVISTACTRVKYPAREALLITIDFGAKAECKSSEPNSCRPKTVFALASLGGEGISAILEKYLLLERGRDYVSEAELLAIADMNGDGLHDYIFGVRSNVGQSYFVWQAGDGGNTFTSKYLAGWSD